LSEFRHVSTVLELGHVQFRTTTTGLKPTSFETARF
jgi:hypothetical protein